MRDKDETGTCKRMYPLSRQQVALPRDFITGLWGVEETGDALLAHLITRRERAAGKAERDVKEYSVARRSSC